jgi:gamma-glutamylcyclotransferase (GGCT)/AIG2-like uncharacterized protein YtfP
MLKINPYLFVYGTLLNKNNSFGAFFMSNSSFVGNGEFSGKLFDIGEYPGAIVAGEGKCRVYGRIFKMKVPEKALEILDDYEGFGEGQPQPNLFKRVLVNVKTDDKTLPCWIYLYNLPVDGLPQIVSGRYLPK